MSIVVADENHTGIIIAADSRCTTQDNQTHQIVSTNDNSNKLFYLDKCFVGIANVGGSNPAGKTVRDFIEFALKQQQNVSTVIDVSINLFKALRLYDLPQHNQIDKPIFFVFGYDGVKACMFDVTKDRIICEKIDTRWGGYNIPIDDLNAKKQVLHDYYISHQDAVNKCCYLVQHTIDTCQLPGGNQYCGGDIEYITVTPTGVIEGHAKNSNIMKITL